MMQQFTTYYANFQELFEPKSTQSKAPASTTNVSRHHDLTLFLKCMILYMLWQKMEKMKK